MSMEYEDSAVEEQATFILEWLENEGPAARQDVFEAYASEQEAYSSRDPESGYGSAIRNDAAYFGRAFDVLEQTDRLQPWITEDGVEYTVVHSDASPEPVTEPDTGILVPGDGEEGIETVPAAEVATDASAESEEPIGEDNLSPDTDPYTQYGREERSREQPPEQ